MNKVNHIILLLLFFTASQVFASSADDVKINSPYARAVPPGQPNSAVYMQLENTSDKEKRIVSASSNVCSIVELHTHLNEDGMMKMRRIDAITIPAKGTTELKPGGLHIMLINLYEGLNPGDSVELEIEYADGSKSKLNAPVKKIMGMAMGKGMGKGMKHHGMKGKKGKKKHKLKHTNPMPNLMKIVKHHGGELALSDKQKEALNKFHDANYKKMHEMMQRIMDLEAQINKAGLSGKSKADILKMADEALDLRKKIIITKADCRDHIKKTLSAEQYSKLIDMYKNKYGSGRSCKN